MKASLHCQRVPGWAPGALRTAGSGWVKIVNPGTGDLFSGLKTDCRIWTDTTDANYISRGVEGGKAFVRTMLPHWGQRGYAECYELANEPPCNSPTDLKLLCEYSIGAMQEALNEGIRLCILNLPEGNPGADQGLTGDAARASERWKLQQLYPAVAIACDMGHYVGLHCYWAPGVEGPLGRWHALGRVEWTVAQWQSMGLNTDSLRLLVTETGIDGGIEGRNPQKGWRSLSNAATYAQEIAQFEQRARQLPWLVAYFLFTAGYENPWADFDIDEAQWSRICQAIKALPDVAAEPTGGAVVEDEIPYNYSSRAGHPITDLVIHGAEGHNVAAYFATKPGVSAHYCIERSGRVDTCVPEELAAWHCGGSTIPGVPSGSVEGTSIVNLRTIGIELACDKAPLAPGWTQVQIDSLVALTKDICKRHGISREHVWRHSDIDSRKQDPRDFRWQAFLDAVFSTVSTVVETVPVAAIRNVAWNALGIPYNPDAAFPKYAREHGLGNPVTREVDVQGYRLQGYAGGIVYAKIGDWGKVEYIVW